MNIEKFHNKQIYLSPYNNISQALYSNLSSNHMFTFKGYIDNYKTGENIYSSAQVTLEYDYIIIISPNHYEGILKDLIHNGLNERKIIFSLFRDDRFIFFSSLRLYQLSSTFFNYAYKVKNISYMRLLQYKNRHKHQRAFILGNGPSLNLQDLELLADEISFAANKIYLGFEQTKWRPTYYFVEDHLVYKQNFDEINSQKLTKFFPIDTLRYGKIKDGIYFNFHFNAIKPSMPNFSNSALKGFYWGATVVYTMIQMAIYMGIKELYIIGLDFSFYVPPEYEKTKETIVSNGEINHFHKDYRKVGEKWNQPKLESQYLAFERTKQYCQEHGIKIYNASRNTKLDVFDKINFDDLFS